MFAFKCQDGYKYGPPPEDIQLKPGSQAVVAEEGGASSMQGGGDGQGEGDGQGHSHSDSDDPLAWLKDSIPGISQLTVSHNLHNIVY